MRSNEASDTPEQLGEHGISLRGTGRQNDIYQFGERCNQLADEENKTENQNESEYGLLGIVAKTGRVPPVKELDERRNQHGQDQHQSRELEKAPHSISIRLKHPVDRTMSYLEVLRYNDVQPVAKCRRSRPSQENESFLLFVGRGFGRPHGRRWRVFVSIFVARCHPSLSSPLLEINFTV